VNKTELGLLGCTMVVRALIGEKVLLADNCSPLLTTILLNIPGATFTTSAA